MSEHHGTFIGYRPQYRSGDKWIDIPTKISTGGLNLVNGVPFPFLWGGYCQEASVMGEAQANAIAYLYKAEIEATPMPFCEVRIVAYDVKFDLVVKEQTDADHKK